MSANQKAYVLRTCNADLRSWNDFQWPESGPVECPDWSPAPECGRGLHGLLWGAGNGNLLSWAPDARWLVVEVDVADVVDIGGKVKVPRGVVVFCGSKDDAIADIIARGAPGPVVGATYTAGYGGTAAAGTRGTAAAGDGGTATAGDGGTATAGTRGILQIRRWDHNAGRWRIAVGYVGEDGIEANVAYRLDENGRFVRVDGTAR